MRHPMRAGCLGAHRVRCTMAEQASSQTAHRDAGSSDSDLVDIHDAIRISGLSRTTIFRKLADPADPFPRPVPLSVHRRKFLRSELLYWRADRMAERGGPAGAHRG